MCSCNCGFTFHEKDCASLTAELKVAKTDILEKGDNGGIAGAIGRALTQANAGRPFDVDDPANEERVESTAAILLRQGMTGAELRAARVEHPRTTRLMFTDGTSLQVAGMGGRGIAGAGASDDRRARLNQLDPAIVRSGGAAAAAAASSPSLPFDDDDDDADWETCVWCDRKVMAMPGHLQLCGVYKQAMSNSTPTAAVGLPQAPHAPSSSVSRGLLTSTGEQRKRRRAEPDVSDRERAKSGYKSFHDALKVRQSASSEADPDQAGARASFRGHLASTVAGLLAFEGTQLCLNLHTAIFSFVGNSSDLTGAVVAITAIANMHNSQQRNACEPLVDPDFTASKFSPSFW
jgi:hypothetical protein